MISMLPVGPLLASPVVYRLMHGFVVALARLVVDALSSQLAIWTAGEPGAWVFTGYRLLGWCAHLVGHGEGTTRARVDGGGPIDVCLSECATSLRKCPTMAGE